MMERVNQVDRYRFGDVGNKEVVLHKVMSSALGCGLNAAAELLRHDGIGFLSSSSTMSRMLFSLYHGMMPCSRCGYLEEIIDNKIYRRDPSSAWIALFWREWVRD
jgi:hypothetical protein